MRRQARHGSCRVGRPADGRAGRTDGRTDGERRGEERRRRGGAAGRPEGRAGQARPTWGLPGRYVTQPRSAGQAAWNDAAERRERRRPAHDARARPRRASSDGRKDGGRGRAPEDRASHAGHWPSRWRRRLRRRWRFGVRARSQGRGGGPAHQPRPQPHRSSSRRRRGGGSCVSDDAGEGEWVAGQTSGCTERVTETGAKSDERVLPACLACLPCLWPVACCLLLPAGRDRGYELRGPGQSPGPRLLASGRAACSGSGVARVQCGCVTCEGVSWVDRNGCAARTPLPPRSGSRPSQPVRQQQPPVCPALSLPFPFLLFLSLGLSSTSLPRRPFFSLARSFSFSLAQRTRGVGVCSSRIPTLLRHRLGHRVFDRTWVGYGKELRGTSTGEEEGSWGGGLG